MLCPTVLLPFLPLFVYFHLFASLVGNVSIFCVFLMFVFVFCLFVSLVVPFGLFLPCCPLCFLLDLLHRLPFFCSRLRYVCFLVAHFCFLLRTSATFCHRLPLVATSCFLFARFSAFCALVHPLYLPLRTPLCPFALLHFWIFPFALFPFCILACFLCRVPWSCPCPLHSVQACCSVHETDPSCTFHNLCTCTDGDHWSCFDSIRVPEKRHCNVRRSMGIRPSSRLLRDGALEWAPCDIHYGSPRAPYCSHASTGISVHPLRTLRRSFRDATVNTPADDNPRT